MSEKQDCIDKLVIIGMLSEDLMTWIEDQYGLGKSPEEVFAHMKGLFNSAESEKSADDCEAISRKLDATQKRMHAGEEKEFDLEDRLRVTEKALVREKGSCKAIDDELYVATAQRIEAEDQANKLRAQVSELEKQLYTLKNENATLQEEIEWAHEHVEGISV